MEMLNSTQIMLSSNLWIKLINLFTDWIANYGWAIIVFTICLKLVLSPLDIYQRIASTKQTKVMSALQPEMTKLQEKYGNDRAKLNEEQAKLYKKYNINIGGLCLPMLITLVVTCVIFFTLFSSLRTFGNEKIYTSFERLDNAYILASNETDATDETIALAVKNEYDLVKKQNGWLWVKNVWKSDTNTTQFVDFEDYVKYKETDESFDKDSAKVRYNAIVNIIDGETRQANGYYGLIIGALVITFLTQYLSAKLMSPKGQKLNSTNKVMLAVIPISMLFFAWRSNTIFTLYIITNSVMSTLISTIISLVTKKKNNGDDKVLLRRKNVEVVEYSRNYKK